MKTIKVAAAIIIKDNKLLATQRGYGEYKGYWEFPGGKLEPIETPEKTAVREIKEELNLNITAHEFLTTIEYDYPDFHLSMDCFACKILSGDLTLNEHLAAKWISKEELSQMNWLPADLELLPILEEYDMTLM